ncbi:2-C-methyl-D-erythritol 4-phosphate cytidylyltransferase [Roseobacter sp.]|uniref:2-C-methyl-D-erythritol 4-phosphate cytidylyltransferase n=1 Tax=Roseobacter sp. TaxID=1907202 RepID=UPI0029669D74|nr:2-C-methyl-D-erythritol 4-phosphate cytidylyltransferase [Roseobacter sp.]MDW3184127.1 2-C-methyl-D-erythritol 4-phosphate cytidylyltransferase [Roseobacter sp.]
MKIAAVIVAAGRGLRAGAGQPKQWRPLAGHSSAYFAMRAFADHPLIDRLVLVVSPDDFINGDFPNDPAAEVVAGGASRSASVIAGLAVLEGHCDQVLIHDAARPCVSRAVIDGVIAALRNSKAAAPAVPVVDALWRGEDGRVAGTVSRDGLFRAQTPQGFHLAEIIAAHRACPEGAADDVELARRAGLAVAITPGSEDNLKITVAEDFIRAERILRARDGHQTG